MNNITSRMIMGFLGLFVMLFMTFQAYNFFSKPFKTETVVRYSVAQSINVKGVAIRSESFLTEPYGGVLRYSYNDATKVAKGDEIAQTFDAREDVQAANQIADMQREIRLLRSAQDPGASDFVHTDVLNREITENVGNIIDMAHQDMVQGVYESKTQLNFLLNQKQVSIKQENDYNERIAFLEQEIAFLSQSGTAATGSIKAPFGGYFVSNVDGYEQVITPQVLEGINYDKLQELFAAEPDKPVDSLGKIVSDHNWYFVVNITDRQLEYFDNVSAVELNFGLANVQPIEAQVQSIIPERGDKNVVVFKCKNVSAELLGIRFQTAQIVFRYYSGYRVNAEAIRYVDGQEGVYVVNKYEMQFVPITVTYRQSGFVLCETQLSDTNKIRLFDEVIVEGKGAENEKTIGTL